MSNHENSLYRSSSSELRKIPLSKSQSKLNEAYISRSKAEQPNPILKTISKINLKPRVHLNAPADRPSHKRTTSDQTQKPVQDTNQFKESLFIFQKFSRKVALEQNIESKVNLLLSLFIDLSRTCSIFSEIFKKSFDIIEDYQKYVKNLDSTRTDNLDQVLEIKNSIFRSDTKRVILMKPKLGKGLAKESSFENRSWDPVKSDKEEVLKPRFSISKIQSISKLEKFSQLKNKSFSKGTVPFIQIPNTEKLDFHDEFMSKFDEFSESWREEALKIKK